MRKPILATLSVLFLAVPLCSASPQQESLGDIARKAREQKKASAKPAKVFTNDDLERLTGRISVLGTPPRAPETEKEATAEPPQGKAGAEDKIAKDKEQKEEKGEVYWRKRFADARAKLHLAEKELDILQRELNLQQQQYYSDPNKALREQYARQELNANTRKIEDKKKEVQQLRQALSDLEDELRRSGGDRGWARE